MTTSDDFEVEWFEERPSNDGYVLPPPLAWDDEANEVVVVRWLSE